MSPELFYANDCNVPIIVCGSVAERGLDEKRGATRATRDVVLLMDSRAQYQLKFD